MDAHNVRVTTPRRRIGPAGGACRLLLTAVMAFSAGLIAYDGISGFSEGGPGGAPWFVIGAGIYYGLYQTATSGFGRRWGIRAVIAFAVVLIAAGATAIGVEGELWAAPLTWLLYGFALGFLILTAVGGLVSLALGTPGCEFGAIGELIRRLRGVPEPEGAAPMWCIFGMHRLDAWEARRSARS
ncbi:MAG TPA: hypothetical protein VEQ37_07475 [Actinomycetota bacterium]|nr:hypothetical protein [Actinomycetota bacterium]